MLLQNPNIGKLYITYNLLTDNIDISEIEFTCTIHERKIQKGTQEKVK